MDDLNMMLEFSCLCYIFFLVEFEGVKRCLRVILRDTVRELVQRKHIKTTVGTTFKARNRIVQYREIQYTGGGFIHTTLTQSGGDRMKTWTFPNEHLGERSATQQP
ncbi:Hypothetical predicted protein [Xyrichtys novacula]|uniref:Secreted protein n=1 Tax=Xyrichtys novacula TaxID=13765 RepID=A0AAV1EL35_XYRNO|nr:Hypothetical predicted protein [Xyrichtys novacula]